MSTARRKHAAFCGKGPNGRNLCFCGCGREVVRPRLNWFSDQCVTNWKLINDPATIRSAVLRRDRSVCAKCGVDTEARAREAREWAQVIRWLARRHYTDLLDRRELHCFRAENPTPSQLAYYEARENCAIGWDVISYSDVAVREEIERRFGKAVVSASGHSWEADHIIPVVEGGGCCGLENYRTLCLSCHRMETANLARRRADARRQKKVEQPCLTLI